MQAPFYKAEGPARAALLDDLQAILDASAGVGISYVLIPLVDNGSITEPAHEQSLLDGLLPLRERLRRDGLKIVFESDFAAQPLARFIAQFQIGRAHV